MLTGKEFRSRLQSESTQLGALLQKKNKNYGNSWDVTAEVLRAFFPDGVKPESYGTILLLVRVFDKISRLAQTERFGTKDEESPWRDIAGYSVLAYVAELVEGEKVESGKAG